MKKRIKKTNEAFGDGRISIDLSNKSNAVTKIIKDNFSLFRDLEKNPQTRTKEAIIELCHQLFDDAGLDTEWTRRFFYHIGKMHSFEQAMTYIGNIYLKGAGLGMNRGLFEKDDEEENVKTESKKCKYTKKQIEESIKYWKKMLKESSYSANSTFATDTEKLFENLVSAYENLKYSFPPDINIQDPEWIKLNEAYKNMYSAISNVIEYFGSDALRR